MPPKKGGKAKNSKKSAKPAWMADDVWAVSQDLPALLNSFAGIKSDKPAKSDKAAAPGKGSKAEPLPNIPKAQVSLAPFGPSTVKTLQHEQGIAAAKHHNATVAAHSVNASLAHTHCRS